MNRRIQTAARTASRPWMLSLVALSAAAGLLAGCSAAQTTMPTVSAPKPMSTQTAANSSMQGMSKAAAKGMVCAECSKKVKPAQVSGEPAVANGAQVVKIMLKDGTYVPNNFTLKSGMPVTVSFEGTATGCLGHPTFKSLGKSLDVTKASGSLDLGSLAPGTYKFGCSMGMNQGALTVR